MAKSYAEFKAKIAELDKTIKELEKLGWEVGQLPDKMPTILDLPFLKNFLGYYKETQLDNERSAML